MESGTSCLVLPRVSVHDVFPVPSSVMFMHPKVVAIFLLSFIYPADQDHVQCRVRRKVFVKIN